MVNKSFILPSVRRHLTTMRQTAHASVSLHLKLSILVPRAHDPSGLRQESRAQGATISGMRHRCRLRETAWAEFGYFLCYFKMVALTVSVAPRALG